MMIAERLKAIWTQAGLSPVFIQKMLSVLPLSGDQGQSEVPSQTELFSRIPGLCCQAVGGQAGWADEVAAAWFLFYYAAHLMDKIEDGDAPEAGWAAFSTGEVLNAASGLFFSASMILNRLHYRAELGAGVAAAAAESFYNGFLVMCDGQMGDLLIPRPILNEYWAIATWKSGAFFSLACRTGARLATADEARLAAFGEFGTQLGVLVQILDDIDDIQQACREPKKKINLEKTLPIAYAREVLPEKEQVRLAKALRSKPARAVEMAENCGATIYVLAEYERRRALAAQSLEAAGAQEEAKAALLSILPNILPEEPLMQPQEGQEAGEPPQESQEAGELAQDGLVA